MGRYRASRTARMVGRAWGDASDRGFRPGGDPDEGVSLSP
jgi:hypothetical protein